MNEPNSHRHIPPDDRMLISLALATVLIHFLSNGGYGYFRDELYAIACSKHLAWGYVDQPPFSEFLLALSGRLLGYSLFALRLWPAVCGGLVAFQVGLIARELDGARYAQALAVTAFVIGGVYLAVDNYYSMNCFDHLFWVLAIYLLVRILKGGDTRLWVLLGLVAGLGLENKYSMGFLGLGLIAGLALTPARRHFLDKWLWLGGALAALIFLPHILWEVRNHFPTAEFIHNVTFKKNLPLTPWAFLRECSLLVHPLTLPIWLAGLGYVFFARQGRKFQTLGWIFLAVLAILLSTHAKPYYFAPAFLLLLPAGGVALEAFFTHRQWNWPKTAYLAVLVLGGALLAPLALPILPVESFIRYQAMIGIKVSSGERRDASPKLPQIFSNMFGWPEMVAQMAQIYNHLSPEDKADCVIGAGNYGEAGAIDFFGKPYGLPNAISSHNNYWYWGPGSKPGKVLLVIGGSKEDYDGLYEDVQQVATFTNPYAQESGTSIFLCRKPQHTLQEVWPHIHNFI
jgi:4-amino-4-deoxy-L-arabinose transferase-like glycosyltransferase